MRIRIFSLTATEKRLLKIELAGGAETIHPAGCSATGIEKTGNLRNQASGSVQRPEGAAKAIATHHGPQKSLQYSMSPGLKSDILSGKTGRRAATSRFIAYRAVCGLFPGKTRNFPGSTVAPHYITIDRKEKQGLFYFPMIFLKVFSGPGRGSSSFRAICHGRQPERFRSTRPSGRNCTFRCAAAPLLPPAGRCFSPGVDHPVTGNLPSRRRLG